LVFHPTSSSLLLKVVIVREKKPLLWLCLYDIHHPQYNKETFRAILSFIRQNRVYGLLLGGDALDLSCVRHLGTGIRRGINAREN
jgi:hypothetical protein